MKISVIVPIYNAELYIIKCVESILGQIYSDLQIILVDDGSTDSSLNICKRLAERDTRIEVYHTENRGSVAARKYGLEKAKGEYIGFVDSDDYIESDMYSNLVLLLSHSGADFIHSGYIEETGRERNIVCNFEENCFDMIDMHSRMEFLQKYILRGTEDRYISPSIWSKVFKAEFIKDCFGSLPEKQQYGEDLLCLCKCILKSSRIVLSRKTLYHYVVRDSSLSHLKPDECTMQEIGLWHHLTEIMLTYGCLERLKEDISFFFRKRMLYVILMDKAIRGYVPCYYYKNIHRIDGKKIVLYGAGCVGQDYYIQIRKYENCEIVAWADTNWEMCQKEYANVVGMEKLLHCHYDIILIAVKDKTQADEIMNALQQQGLFEKEIIWEKPGCILDSCG